MDRDVIEKTILHAPFEDWLMRYRSNYVNTVANDLVGTGECVRIVNQFMDPSQFDTTRLFPNQKSAEISLLQQVRCQSGNYQT